MFKANVNLGVVPYRSPSLVDLGSFVGATKSNNTGPYCDSDFPGQLSMNRAAFQAGTCPMFGG